MAGNAQCSEIGEFHLASLRNWQNVIDVGKSATYPVFWDLMKREVLASKGLDTG